MQIQIILLAEVWTETFPMLYSVIVIYVKKIGIKCIDNGRDSVDQ